MKKRVFLTCMPNHTYRLRRGYVQEYEHHGHKILIGFDNRPVKQHSANWYATELSSGLLLFGGRDRLKDATSFAPQYLSLIVDKWLNDEFIKSCQVAVNEQYELIKEINNVR